MQTGPKSPSTLASNVSTYPLKKAQIVGAVTTMTGLCARKLHLKAIRLRHRIRVHITTMRTTGTTALEESGQNGTTTAMTGASGLLKEMMRQ